jgi:acetyl esterase/lipase
VGGCRVWLDPLALNLAQDGFMVFNIDVRLACTDDDVYLCGFHATTQVDDVNTAISWVRDNASTYGSFSGDVVAVGTSAGGSLAFMAAVTGVAADSVPDIVAGFSGHPEMGFMSDDEPSCDAGPTQAERDICWRNSEQYMNVLLTLSGTHCNDNWATASPACVIDPENLPPPTYIANGTNELSAYQAALDLGVQLDFYGMHDWTLCSVSQGNGEYHGTELFGKACDSPLTGNAYDNMIEFIEANL